MPGAISTHSDAWPGTGRNPREVFPMNVASCGWSASRKQYVRRVIPIAGVHAITRRASGSAAAPRNCTGDQRDARAVSGSGTDHARARSVPAWVDTAERDLDRRRMQHLSRFAAILGAAFVLVIARPAHAEEYAVRRVIQVAQGGGTGTTPTPTNPPTNP